MKRSGAEGRPVSRSATPRASRGRPTAYPEKLLKEAYLHLACRRHTTSTLAAALGLSPATAFRIVKVLRRQGRRIVSMKEGAQWYFDVRERMNEAWQKDPLVKARGFIRGVRWPRGKQLNDIVDDSLYGQP